LKIQDGVVTQVVCKHLMHILIGAESIPVDVRFKA